jgi:hypothetical protein
MVGTTCKKAWSVNPVSYRELHTLSGTPLRINVDTYITIHHSTLRCAFLNVLGFVV